MHKLLILIFALALMVSSCGKKVPVRPPDDADEQTRSTR